MFYFLDESRTTTHLGALLIVTPERATATSDDADASHPPRPALDYSNLVTLVENRLQLVPRYRQVVREVTLGLARPVWVDDRDFDINFHIRRSGLPRPGGPADLADLIARVMSRPLDRTRPLWEMYLIEGLADGKLAILTKSHRCLLDDDGGNEISEVICDEGPESVRLPEELWIGHGPERADFDHPDRRRQQNPGQGGERDFRHEWSGHEDDGEQDQRMGERR